MATEFRLCNTMDGTDAWWDKYYADMQTIADAFNLSLDEAIEMDFNGEFAYGN